MADAAVPCPIWCAGHHLDDPGVDPVHQRDAAPIPVVILTRVASLSGGQAPRVEATELELVMYQEVGDDEVWVMIGSGGRRDQRLELSLGSARRVRRALSAFLAETGCAANGSGARS